MFCKSNVPGLRNVYDCAGQTVARFSFSLALLSTRRTAQLPTDIFSANFLRFCPGVQVHKGITVVLSLFRGAFHYAKDSGNFGRNSNGKDRFGFF